MVTRNKLRRVKKHLRGDSQTWAKIEKIAHEERASDLKMIRRLN